MVAFQHAGANISSLRQGLFAIHRQESANVCISLFHAIQEHLSQLTNGNLSSGQQLPATKSVKLIHIHTQTYPILGTRNCPSLAAGALLTAFSWLRQDFTSSRRNTFLRGAALVVGGTSSSSSSDRRCKYSMMRERSSCRRGTSSSSTWSRANSATCMTCLLYTSDAADEYRGVDLGGRRIIKK